MNAELKMPEFTLEEIQRLAEIERYWTHLPNGPSEKASDECHHLPKQAAWCPKCQQSMPGGDALHTDHCPALKTNRDEAARLVTSTQEPPHCASCSCPALDLRR